MTTCVNPLPNRALVGMVHLAPLPGSPAASYTLDEIIRQALADARTLLEAGFDAIIVENFGDAPFRPSVVDPQTVACMTRVIHAIRQEISIPVGVNVLRNDALAAVAIAAACEAAFVRVNVHTGVYATDQGIIEGRADETLRYRRRIQNRSNQNTTGPALFADVHVKHAAPLFRQPIADAVQEVAYRGRADALIVSGTATGKPTNVSDILAVRKAVPDRPILVGSGATADNVAELLDLADGVIVGTAIKQDGVTTAAVDLDRARTFARRAR